MRDVKKKRGTGAVSAFLGAGSGIEGTLEFQGTMRVDGNVRGKIIGDTLIIGKNAVVNADIAVRCAVIMGEVSGTVEAGEKIEICPPGCVAGDIRSPLVSINSGAVFNGNCGMESPRTGSPEKLPDGKLSSGKTSEEDNIWHLSQK